MARTLATSTLQLCRCFRYPSRLLPPIPYWSRKCSYTPSTTPTSRHQMPSNDKEHIHPFIDDDQPPSHPAAPRQIYETGPLLAHIDILSLVARHLDDGRPHELARCLTVSHVFYEAMAPGLHRHVRLPDCEFTMTRGGRRSCAICLNAGRTVKPGSYCRHTFKNRPFSTDQIGRALDREVTARQTEMLRAVQTATLGPHSDCHAFAENFSLPLLRTIDIETGAFWKRFCAHGTGECNLLPRERSIRLITSHLCSGSLCRYHVPLALQSGRVNSLAIRLPGDLTEFPPCGIPLPTSVTAFRPKRLAILFPILTKLELREASTKRPSIFLHRPASMRGRSISQEFFYRIANTCIRTQHASQILIVAADHGALKIANLHAYDCSLDPSKGNLFRGHWPIGPKNVIRETKSLRQAWSIMRINQASSSSPVAFGIPTCSYHRCSTRRRDDAALAAMDR